MDSEDELLDINATVLDPDKKLRELTRHANSIVIDPRIPPKRYFRSGCEMVRMGNQYYADNELENAFTLYMKYITLFVEKIREHPDFATVPKVERDKNFAQIKEVIPKAEKLKAELLNMYKEEYERWLRQEKKKKEMERVRGGNKVNNLRHEEPVILPKPSPNQILHIAKVPVLDGLDYPTEEFCSTPAVKPKPQLKKPEFDRCTKPSMLLSPTLSTGLRVIIVPGTLMNQFLNIASKNTYANVETCAILAGKMKKEQLVITHLLVPEQVGSCDSCLTQKEEDLFDYQDQHDLITFGWIHTHPTQTSFLSSVDLHTHYAYQRMIPEAIAIVCAPRYSENSFFCLTPDYGLNFIGNCNLTGFHPHPSSPELFMVAEHYKLDPRAPIEVVDLRRR